MGRFHRHDDDIEHAHDHSHARFHEDRLGDHSGYRTGRERIDVLERIFHENDRSEPQRLRIPPHLSAMTAHG